MMQLFTIIDLASSSPVPAVYRALCWMLGSGCVRMLAFLERATQGGHSNVTNHRAQRATERWSQEETSRLLWGRLLISTAAAPHLRGSKALSCHFKMEKQAQKRTPSKWVTDWRHRRRCPDLAPMRCAALHSLVGCSPANIYWNGPFPGTSHGQVSPWS